MLTQRRLRHRIFRSHDAVAISARRTARRRMVIGTLGAALTCTLTLSPARADAAADGCTYTQWPTDYVCGAIPWDADPLFVRYFDVVRGRFSGEAIRDYHAVVRFEPPTGKAWVFRSKRHTGKTFVRATRTVNVNRAFPDGTRACGSFYEAGELQDTVCLTIHS
jgi:hypothetical protein